jgi:ribosomal protein L16 Arg81 hydroxylase
MNIEGFDLTRLLKPVNPEDFFAEYWERKPLHIQRRDHGYYGSLLSQQDLEDIISSSDLRYPAIKLVPKGSNAFYRPETYTTNFRHGGDVFNGVPDIDKIFAEYRAGATVTLPGLEQNWEPLGALCRGLESTFDHAVRANVYITGGNTHGFTPHYDPHEVFVLQLAGKKHWRVYDQPLALPLVSQPFGGQPFARNYDNPPPPQMEIDLEAGDLLYLPRGYVHAAATSDSFSAHVTIGITVYTWIDLAAEMFMSCMGYEQFRGALPPGFASDAGFKDTLRQGLMKLAENMQNNSDYDKLIDNFTKRVLAGRSRGKGSFQCDVTVP